MYWGAASLPFHSSMDRRRDISKASGPNCGTLSTLLATICRKTPQARMLGVPGILRREMVVDLFEPPQRVALRERVMDLRARGKTEQNVVIVHGTAGWCWEALDFREPDTGSMRNGAALWLTSEECAEKAQETGRPSSILPEIEWTLLAQAEGGQSECSERPVSWIAGRGGWEFSIRRVPSA
jgi:hypothetical protein